MSCPIFFNRAYKVKLKAAPFSYFLDLKKIKFRIQIVNVLNVIMSLYCNETSYLNCFVYITLPKGYLEINLGEVKSDKKNFAK